MVLLPARVVGLPALFDGMEDCGGCSANLYDGRYEILGYQLLSVVYWTIEALTAAETLGLSLEKAHEKRRLHPRKAAGAEIAHCRDAKQLRGVVLGFSRGGLGREF